MEIIVKGADFSAISIGKYVILPEEIDADVKQLVDLYANSNIAYDSIKAKALQWLYDMLGGGTPNSIWDKLRALYIPAMANDVRDCFYELKRKFLYSEVPNWCNSTNVDLNVLGAKPTSAFNRGFAPIHGFIGSMIDKTVFGFTYNKNKENFAPINTNGITSGQGKNIYIESGRYKYGYIDTSSTPAVIDSSGSNYYGNGLLAISYGQSGDKVRLFVDGKSIEGETMGDTTYAETYKATAFTGSAGWKALYPQKETAICGKTDTALTDAELVQLNKIFESFMDILVNYV